MTPLSDHIVFVRFFIGYDNAYFPLGRVAGLKDSEVAGAGEALRREGWCAKGLVKNPQITRRYPLVRFRWKERADDAAAYLQERVLELKRATYAKDPSAFPRTRS
jgi:hypothetical protein